jgi:hypothetical protein
MNACKSLFGEPLSGDALVRNIYTDEAGTSDLETIRVVAALAVHADTQWIPVLNYMAALFREKVPKQYQEDFAFHAKLITAGNKYPDWDFQERIAFLHRVMEIPRGFRIPIIMAAVRKGSVYYPHEPLTPAEAEHALAFSMCMGKTNDFLRKNYPGEMGQVVAADISDRRKILKNALRMLRNEGVKTSIGGSVMFTSDRVVDEVHFMEPKGSQFLQLADACAYAFRSYLTGHKFGGTYIQSVIGNTKLDAPEVPWASLSAAFGAPGLNVS